MSSLGVRGIALLRYDTNPIKIIKGKDPQILKKAAKEQAAKLALERNKSIRLVIMFVSISFKD